jgi:hypothetical protein
MTSVGQRPTRQRRADNAPWGPFGDHMLCAMLNDLRVCERLARTHLGRTHSMTCGNALPLLTVVKWSQVQILSARLEN